ncbi:MAG: hypothetical protein WAS07_14565 [Micropruina sp.]
MPLIPIDSATDPRLADCVGCSGAMTRIDDWPNNNEAMKLPGYVVAAMALGRREATGPLTCGFGKERMA